MPDIDIINKSVTKQDYSESPQGGAFYLSIGMWPQARGLPPSLEGLGFKDRNAITASTLDFEALWAGSVSIALAKISSLSWEVEGNIPLRTRRAHDLLLNADAGRGWVSFLAKLLQDYLLTDNGAFMEIVREKVGSPNSPIIGLIPLDTLRCTRTGDPEIPVIYLDMKGQYHELQSFEVVEFADMPSSRANLFGSGKCAASRAYRTIYKQSGIEAYISDKVTGRRPLAVNFISGLNDIQLRSVLRTAQSEADARGAIAYMGAIMATVPGDAAPGIATVPLADFPDNFNRKEEVDITLLTYADNLGLDPQDLQPLTGQSLGSGAQSQVLAEKAKGKGLAAFRQQFMHALNLYVLPDGCTFEFEEKDWRDKNQQAEYNAKIETYVSDSVKNGILSANQGLQALVDEDIYPKEFLPVDITPDDTLSDDEKQEEPEAAQDLAAPMAPLVPAPPIPPTAPPVPVPTAKELVVMARSIQKDYERENHHA